MKKAASSNGAIKIEKGIPMPINHHRGQRIYPFDKLEIGESFFVAGRTPVTIGSSTSYARIKLRRRFMARAATENGVDGVRVWRTE